MTKVQEVIAIKGRITIQCEEVQAYIKNNQYEIHKHETQEELNKYILNINTLINEFNFNQHSLQKRNSWLNFRVPSGETDNLSLEKWDILEIDNPNLKKNCGFTKN